MLRQVERSTLVAPKSTSTSQILTSLNSKKYRAVTFSTLIARNVLDLSQIKSCIFVKLQSTSNFCKNLYPNVSVLSMKSLDSSLMAVSITQADFGNSGNIKY